MENQTVTVRGVVAFPHLVEQTTYKGKPTGKYSIQIANLSQAAVAKLESMGIDVKAKEDDKFERGQFIECKSKFPINNEGKYAMLFESDGKTKIECLPEEIGYGSTVRATIRPYQTDDGYKPSLVKMSVEDLVHPEVAVGDEEGEVL